MSDNERTIINRLTKEGETPTSKFDAKTIQPLIDTAVVIKDESKGVYRLNGVLLRRVLEEETSQALAR